MAGIAFRTTTPNGLSYNWSDNSNWDLGHAPMNGDSVTLSSGGVNASLYLATDDIPLLTLQSLTVADFGALLNIADGSTLLAGNVFNDGLISVGGALLTFDTVNSGVVNIASGGAYLGINLSGGGQLFVQDGGKAMIGAFGVGGVSGDPGDAQSFHLRGGLLDIEAATVGAATFSFDGASHSHLELSLAAAAGLTAANTFTGLGAGDLIELENDGLTGFSYDAGTQTLTLQAGAQSIALHIASFDGGASGFSLTSDPLTGNRAIQVACFLRGTRFAGEAGEVAVEQIRIGDRLRTASGALRAVKWVGRRAYARALAAADDEIRPVLVRRGALGAGLPARELRLSPHHALMLDGTLIEARLLTNGEGIVPAEIDADVEYFNIELDSHDVILAEGVPVETFIDDNGSRAMFDNAAEFAALYPGDDAIAKPFCAPRPLDGFAVELQRRKLSRPSGEVAQAGPSASLRANVEECGWSSLRGWAFDPANPGTPVDIDVVVDGVRVASALANAYRDDLRQAGLGAGRCGFTIALPIRLEPSVPHVVRLLVAGTRTELPGSPVLLDAIPSLEEMEVTLTRVAGEVVRDDPKETDEAIAFLLAQIGTLAHARSALGGAAHAPSWTVGRA